jgi:hypothetical protein
MWFDGGPEIILIEEICCLQPHIVINPKQYKQHSFRHHFASL